MSRKLNSLINAVTLERVKPARDKHMCNAIDPLLAHRDEGLPSAYRLLPTTNSEPRRLTHRAELPGPC